MAVIRGLVVIGGMVVIGGIFLMLSIFPAANAPVSMMGDHVQREDILPQVTDSTISRAQTLSLFGLLYDVPRSHHQPARCDRDSCS
jgi:hypothetical protein